MTIQLKRLNNLQNKLTIFTKTNDSPTFAKQMTNLQFEGQLLKHKI